MAIKCPKCKKIYELSAFDAQESLFCVCGQSLGVEQEDVMKSLNEICTQYKLKLEEGKVVQIRKMADSIVSLIMNIDYSRDYVKIQKNKLRDLILEISPDKVHLYGLIYEPRFERLWKKFRESDAD
ncbi:MAG: hypothetical protein L6416_07900 [Candidatus Omnitrophica bacterium]|nr:hypothetical protein [Candidatus Omnitrophota bacterium]